MRNYQDFEKICREYYGKLKEQRLTTAQEIFHVLDGNTVVVCWSGDIDAFFKNGDSWKMPDYTVTYIFRKIKKEWKIIHSHESALPPRIIRQE
jgi:ketosteroid isomerase-like protein